jgi:poly-beta-hydroxyalkanoate depolymerase
MNQEEIYEINRKLDRILELLETDGKKMSEHIDFIDNVYNNMKNPLHFIMNKVNSVFNLQIRNEEG